ncbi:MAG: transporter associated domain-containing protein, partial [Guyparkeria sp.]
VQGIVTLEDILEEIVGEFTTDIAASIPEIHPQDDGSQIIDGTALLRDINRGLGWRLPQDGPRTLNGLIVEHLEFIPEANCCLQIGDYRIEVVQIKDNMIRTARMTAPEIVEDDTERLDDG